ncbi:SAM-dependent methyltransferase [Streptomyces coffeae]|uniref:Methyltransferase domain-containing protein n=1 Tax=Streptomyces coffeae TaxID=621382 RepID=A0ABS1NQL4_9ACTN|nr:methyltransferase domain-containing protein [Streptomyces coffeae]MBL1102380.1 methyltransferase domain-containing protein [Streptomyces coffeae]
MSTDHAIEKKDMTDKMDTQPELVSDFYDVFTHMFLRFWGENFHYGYWLSDEDDSSVDVATDRLTDLLIEHLGLRPGQRMLDVGCGIGTPALRLAGTVEADITGVTINSGQAQEANARAAVVGLSHRVRFDHADAMALPYPDASFDVAWAFESLLHMERSRALAEMRRVLRPGGRLVIADTCQREPIRPEYQDILDDAKAKFAIVELPSIDDYRALITGAGLELDELLDVSEHTRRTLRIMADGASEHRSTLEEQFGDAARQLIEVLVHPMSALPEFGYLVATARKMP